MAMGLATVMAGVMLTGGTAAFADEKKEDVTGEVRYAYWDNNQTPYREKRNTPIDAYDSAAMMAVTLLSEQSICTGGMPAAFPDFTNGAWIMRKRWEPGLADLNFG